MPDSSGSTPRGIARFIDGRFGLDRILAATAAEPEAFQEVQRERVALLHADREAQRRRIKDARTPR